MKSYQGRILQWLSHFRGCTNFFNTLRCERLMFFSVLQLSLQRNVWLLEIKLKAEKNGNSFGLTFLEVQIPEGIWGKGVKLKQMETQTGLFAI